MRKRVLLIGANNPETLRIIEDINSVADRLEVVGWLDNSATKHGTTVFGFPVLGPPELLSEVKYEDCSVFNNVTRSGVVRMQVTEQVKQHTEKFVSLVHPSVNVDHVMIGHGVCVQAGAVIQSHTILEDGCSISSNCVIGHESRIGQDAFVAGGCVIAGLTQIGEGATVWSGAVIGPRLKVGNRAIVGLNSAVLKDVPGDTTVHGNPARKIYDARFASGDSLDASEHSIPHRPDSNIRR